MKNVNEQRTEFVALCNENFTEAIKWLLTENGLDPKDLGFIGTCYRPMAYFWPERHEVMFVGIDDEEHEEQFFVDFIKRIWCVRTNIPGYHWENEWNF